MIILLYQNGFVVEIKGVNDTMHLVKIPIRYLFKVLKLVNFLNAIES